MNTHSEIQNIKKTILIILAITALATVVFSQTPVPLKKQIVTKHIKYIRNF